MANHLPIEVQATAKGLLQKHCGFGLWFGSLEGFNNIKCCEKWLQGFLCFLPFYLSESCNSSLFRPLLRRAGFPHHAVQDSFYRRARGLTGFHATRNS